MIDVKTFQSAVPRLVFYRRGRAPRAERLSAGSEMLDRMYCWGSLTVTLLALSGWNFQTNLQICGEALFKLEQSVIMEDMRRFGFLKREREPEHALNCAIELNMDSSVSDYVIR